MVMTDTELRALPPVYYPGGEANPFKAAVQAGEPGAWELSRRWAMIHWPEAFAEPIDAKGNPFDAMERDLALLDSNIWRISTPGGGCAFFPQTAKDEKAWEESLAAMTASQVTDVPEPKPDPSSPTRGRIVRGD